MLFRKSIAALAALTVFASTQAQALSCLKPSIEQSFNSWADSSDFYYIASGKLTPLGPLPPVPAPGTRVPGEERPELRAVYQFDGTLIGTQEDSPLSHVIWVRVNCLGDWCGGFPTDEESGVFALKNLPDMTLEANFSPCPGDRFLDPTGEIETKVRNCMRAGRCQ